MKILVEKISGITVVTMDGELSVDNSIALRESFLKMLKEGSTKVLVDFEKVTFVCSAGLATLIEMMQMLKKSGGKLAICNVNKDVKGLFEITKIHKLIPIYEHREMAMKDLGT
ncbi:MAG: STAS domain-containing protein [Candidatus Omnitrophica bacterium]|nr:STAS domain-containing protein [Candidatus Omnitrophota bacterium]